MSKTKIIIRVCAIVGIVAIVVGFLLLDGNKIYKVTFDTDGGSSIVIQEVKQNDKANKPENPTKNGYTFIRWEYQEKEYDFTSAITRDITLKAIWEKNEEQEIKYKITFSVGDMLKTIEISNQNEINISSLGFEEKSGYEIKWYVDGKEYDLNTPISSDMKIEGKYVKVSNSNNTSATFKVKFDSKGGTSVKTQTINSSDKATEPESITYYGFIFDGWYLNNKKYDFDTPVTKNITLIAKWKEDSNVKRYTVKFDSDGGSKVSEQRIIENKLATAPKNPTKAGYKFVEWQLNGKKYDFKTKVTKDIILKAKWEEDIQYMVTFDTNSGSKINSIKVSKNGKVTKPKDPTKSGYKFDGWLLNNKEYDFNTPVTGDITLVARYSANATPTPTPATYTITATKADNMASTDSLLKVFKNGQQISVKEIQFSDGQHLCDGSKLVVMTSDITGESTFIVVLNDNTKVKATLK